MEELIKRLKAATGPDRQLSDDILLACGWLGQSESSKLAGIMIPHWKDPDLKCWPTPPHVTESIDAALTLVPDPWQGVYLTSEWSGGWKKSQASTFKYICTLRRAVHSYVTVEARGASNAIAICIASLMAMQRDKQP